MAIEVLDEFEDAPKLYPQAWAKLPPAARHKTAWEYSPPRDDKTPRPWYLRPALVAADDLSPLPQLQSGPSDREASLDHKDLPAVVVAARPPALASQVIRQRADAAFEEGAALLRGKRYTEAIKSFSHALEVLPTHVDALIFRAAAKLNFKGRHQAESSELDARAALKLQPQNSATVVESQLLIAGARGALGDSAGALTALKAVLAASPKDPRAHRALAREHARLGEWREAWQHLDALPSEASHRGPPDKIDIDRERLEVAISLLLEHSAASTPGTAAMVADAQMAAKAFPKEPRVLLAQAQILKQAWKLDEMAKVLERRATLLQESKGTVRQVSLVPHRLRHDLEQLRYIRTVVVGKASRKERLIERAIPAIQAALKHKKLSQDHEKALLQVQGTPWHVVPPARLSGSALSPTLDAAGIEAQWLSSTPRIVTIDDLLSEEAVQALRKYCLESTVWWTDKTTYLGAYPYDAFRAPLLLQIAEELPRRLPRILGNLTIENFWAYKYDNPLGASSAARGIHTHADAAAVNLNLWISEDGSNLDEGGGLEIFNKEAPGDWDFAAYNAPKQRGGNSKADDFLRRHNAVKHTVGHRRNRAVLFDSGLFHRTAALRFRPGYNHRRINLTFLYGRTADRPRALPSEGRRDTAAAASKPASKVITELAPPLGQPRRGEPRGAAAAPGELSDALKATQLALRSRPHDPALLSELGAVLRQERRPTEALAAFRAAVRHGPSFADAYHNLAALLSDEASAAVQNDTEAAAAYRHAWALRPTTAVLGLNLGRVQLRLGAFDEANLALQKARKGLSPEVRRSAEYVFSTSDYITQHVLTQRPPPAVTPHYIPQRLWEVVAGALPKRGLLLEFGVAGGTSINYLADLVAPRLIHGFDWFQGLPEDWRPGLPAGSFSQGGAPPEVRENVRLHVGLFNETVGRVLRTMDSHSRQSVALAHVDCDLYRSAREVLLEVGPRLVKGSIMLFDEYLGVPAWEAHEHRAWQEACKRFGIQYRFVALDGTRVAMEVLQVRPRLMGL